MKLTFDMTTLLIIAILALVSVQTLQLMSVMSVVSTLSAAPVVSGATQASSGIVSGVGGC